MMQTSMFGAEPATDTTEYDSLTDTACSFIPACAAIRGLTAAASGVADDTLVKAQAAATQVMAPTLAQLQRLERAITWAAVGTIVALAAATGTVIYVAATRRKS
jgi:hypothetical protein